MPERMPRLITRIPGKVRKVTGRRLGASQSSPQNPVYRGGVGPRASKREFFGRGKEDTQLGKEEGAREGQMCTGEEHSAFTR